MAASGRARPCRWGKKNACSSTCPRPAAFRSATTSSTRYWRGLRSKIELPLRVARDVAEECAAVSRVVDGAEARRARNVRGRPVGVEVREHDLGAVAHPAPGGLHHRTGQVYADIAKTLREQRLGEAGVAAGKVEHGVAGVKCRADRNDQVGTVR